MKKIIFDPNDWDIKRLETIKEHLRRVWTDESMVTDENVIRYALAICMSEWIDKH